MGALKGLTQELEDNLDHYTSGLVSLNKIPGGVSNEAVTGLAELLKVAQRKAIETHLGLGYDSQKEQPQLEKDQHDDCVSDSRPIPRTDVGGP